MFFLKRIDRFLETLRIKNEKSFKRLINHNTIGNGASNAAHLESILSIRENLEEERSLWGEQQEKLIEIQKGSLDKVKKVHNLIDTLENLIEILREERALFRISMVEEIEFLRCNLLKDNKELKAEQQKEYDKMFYKQHELSYAQFENEKLKRKIKFLEENESR